MGLSTTVGPAQDKVEVPKGYEEAVPAEEKRPAARAAPAAKDRPPREKLNQSVLGILADAVGKRAEPKVRKLAPQNLVQIQQLLTPELAFVRRVCEPDKEQFREVGTAVRERFGVAAGAQAVVRNAVPQFGGRARGMAMAQLRTLLQQEVTTIIKAKLRPEQVERYVEECEHRAARRKRAVVLNLIAKLDEELALSADQREKLMASLDEGYQESWDQWLQMLAHIAQFTPDIPQDCVLPVLSEKQKAVWRQSNKMGIQAMGIMNFAPNMVVIEDDDWEELEDGR